MDEKNRKTAVAMSHAVAMARTTTFWISLFAACYLAVLPMADTIALRNVALFALLLCLAWRFRKISPSFQWPLPLVLWGIYLLVFPFIADSSATALESMLSQWGRGVLAMLAGTGVAAIFYSKNKGAAFYLGLLSAVPILVHLSLFIWKAWMISAIPWGYWGRETHHADLGYAAGQAVILLAAAIVAGHKALRPLAVMLMVACLLSTALAHSRAGFAFCVLGGVLVFIAAYVGGAAHRRLNFLAGALGVVFLGVVVLVMAAQNDTRWRNMTSQLIAGFKGDALQIQCEGTASIKSEIIAEYGPGNQARDVLASVRDGDGSRMVLLRAGLTLALEHPWGSDGSRQAYQKLLRQQCPNPVIAMAHTHNGWLDTLLALGWVGATLYSWVLLYFLKQGWAYLRREHSLNEWSLVLVALSTFWILRGFTDSVFRDHMLEMQGFVLAYAAMALRMQVRSEVPSGSPEAAS
jgi:hypothetical protein